MSMDEVLQQLLTHGSDEIQPLQQLISCLRPARPDDGEQATQNVRALAFLLQQNVAYQQGLRAYLERVILSRKLVHLLTDTGIPANEGFWSALWRRFNARWLPPACNDRYLKDVLLQVFDLKRDAPWLMAVAPDTWLALLHAMGWRRRDAVLRRYWLQEALEAAQVLSYRMTAIGLEPELVRNYPAIERFESPFLRQNTELMAEVAACQQALGEGRVPRLDARHMRVLLAQCAVIVSRIRKSAAQQGVSVSLTRLLLRLEASMARLELLLDLLSSRWDLALRRQAVSLFQQLMRASRHQYSLREVFHSNTELLALQVTERAGQVGEHYVTTDRAGWFSMLRSAMGAGGIVGFMALLKVLAGKLVLAPFGYAFLYSLNYSLGFMLVHVLHFTIATKQPAMTASKLAASIDAAVSRGKAQLEELAELCVQVARSQFSAIMGNVLVAMPTALVIALFWQWASGQHLANPDKVAHLLHDLHPWQSLALPHAAIAGVCLFLSGLISGYYDNKASYNQIPERLQQLGWLRRLLGPQRLQRVARYVGDNLGALAGNFFFGLMLGSIGTLGFIFGLPIDIRHITFSSANFVFALVGSDFQLPWQVWSVSLLGVALIGMVNLVVSFSLALLVALHARRVSFGQGRSLLAALGRRFIRQPGPFFFPPRDTAAEKGAA
ncbi:site-specific recombinase [Leeia aquatica]|nr:site-specific recombinase [Leeia aquatica]